jgi:hypothetical protein
MTPPAREPIVVAPPGRDEGAPQAGVASDPPACSSPGCDAAPLVDAHGPVSGLCLGHLLEATSAPVS